MTTPGFAKRLKTWLALRMQNALNIPQILASQSDTLQRLEQLKIQLERVQAATELPQQDTILLLSRFLQLNTSSPVQLETQYPIAFDSLDHKFPLGTKQDNTRYLRFGKKCEELFDHKIKFLDLGCAGGGLVWDFLLRGHLAIGLEGSNYSYEYQRAEWRLIPNHLFTCDITKPFKVLGAGTAEIMQFDIISAWEVLEHIPQDLLPALMENIHQHLAPNGLFVASVATFSCLDPVSGVELHVTIKPRDWWEARFRSAEFEIVHDLFATLDFPRGSGNGSLDWSAIEQPEMGFHLVVRAK